MEHLTPHYNPSFVALSFAVAIFASFVALDMVGSVARASRLPKALWLMAGALAMGGGIWSMHFIGMLAFQMPDMQMSYDIRLMMVSIAVAVAASGFALFIMSRPTVSKSALTASAFAMAAAIAGMHYIGMFSMRMPVMIVWNLLLVGLSLLIALAASFCAFIVASRLRAGRNHFTIQSGASVLLGLAIAGMHYVGMEAAQFHHADITIDPNRSVLASSELAIVVVAVTVLILALALSGSVIERLLNRRALREQEHELKAQEAQSANALKTQFLANMSHEIRTPLGAIIGFTELMLEEDFDETQRTAHLQTVLRSGRALLGLLNDILDLSKIEMNKLEVDKQTFELRPFLEDIINMFRIKADAKGLALVFEFDETLPKQIVSDPTRLRQIVINLIGNAIKFTSAGTVRVRVRREGAATDKKLALEIKDTGVGLTTEQASRLFQPFTQADNSTTRVFGGTGLGLDISRRLAQALGGTVEITESAPLKGTTFRATIAHEEPPQLASQVPTSLQSPAVELDGLKVLIVDDNQDNQVLISRILVRRGATVATAFNGKLGVEAALEARFDVILMDIQMPVMNGYEAIRELRARGNPTPIVALTANAFKEERKMCFDSGCDGYLTKPVEVAELISTIQSFKSRTSALPHSSLR